MAGTGSPGVLGSIPSISSFLSPGLPPATCDGPENIIVHRATMIQEQIYRKFILISYQIFQLNRTNQVKALKNYVLNLEIRLQLISIF